MQMMFPTVMGRQIGGRTGRNWVVRVLLCALSNLGLLAAVEAAPPPPFSSEKPITVRSQSGQFVVSGLPMGPPLRIGSTSAVQYLRLDPNLTAISLERIRQAIQTELAWPDKWGGLITVNTQPLRGEDARVTMTGVHYADGWGYRIDFPEIVDKDRFLHATVKTILLEFANRRAHMREAEIPPWLVEGMAAVLAVSMPVLALEPSAEINRRERVPDSLASVRESLRQHEPLSLDDLSVPDKDWERLTVENALHFRACAHLFVHELLRLRDGRACLRQMLERLPENLNWQTTFLQSFGQHFSRLLDIDQWWALHAAGVRGRDRSSVFPAAVTLQQLQEILATTVDVRVDAQELPMRLEMTLPRLVTEWDYPRQHAVLVEKIARLTSLKGRAPTDWVGLIDDYRMALVDYVGSNRLRLPVTEKERNRLRPRGTATDLVRRLAILDARRAAPASASK
jgi:hypothetical protein